MNGRCRGDHYVRPERRTRLLGRGRQSYESPRQGGKEREARRGKGEGNGQESVSSLLLVPFSALSCIHEFLFRSSTSFPSLLSSFCSLFPFLFLLSSLLSIYVFRSFRFFFPFPPTTSLSSILLCFTHSFTPRCFLSPHKFLFPLILPPLIPSFFIPSFPPSSSPPPRPAAKSLYTR